MAVAVGRFIGDCKDQNIEYCTGFYELNSAWKLSAMLTWSRLRHASAPCRQIISIHWSLNSSYLISYFVALHAQNKPMLQVV